MTSIASWRDRVSSQHVCRVEDNSTIWGQPGKRPCHHKQSNFSSRLAVKFFGSMWLSMLLKSPVQLPTHICEPSTKLWRQFSLVSSTNALPWTRAKLELYHTWIDQTLIGEQRSVLIVVSWSHSHLSCSKRNYNSNFVNTRAETIVQRVSRGRKLFILAISRMDKKHDDTTLLTWVLKASRLSSQTPRFLADVTNLIQPVSVCVPW